MKRAWILLILLLAGGLRSIGLDTPLIGEHSHRQTDTASIARNFYRGGYDFLRPEVDWGGSARGYVESEFPLYTALVSVGYAATGVDERVGRACSAVFSVIGIAFLWALARDRAGESAALWAAWFLALLPTHVFFGRAFMPEALMLMASAAGIFFFSRWIEQARPRDFALSASFVATACLVKLPALVLGAPLLYLASLRFGRRALLRPALWLYALLVLAPVTLWYWHAHQLGIESRLSFGILDYGSGKWGNWELVSSFEYWKRILLYRLMRSHLTYAGVLLFGIGLLVPRKLRGERVFDVWLLAMLFYLTVVGVGNWLHNYYQLPILLPAAVFMGKACARHIDLRNLRAPACVAVGVLALLVPLMSAERLGRLFGREDAEQFPGLALAERVRSASHESELLVAANGTDPTLLYLSDRKGFVAAFDALSQQEVARLRGQGAALLAGTRGRSWSREQEARLAGLAERYEATFDDGRSYIIRITSQ